MRLELRPGCSVDGRFQEHNRLLKISRFVVVLSGGQFVREQSPVQGRNLCVAASKPFSLPYVFFSKREVVLDELKPLVQTYLVSDPLGHGSILRPKGHRHGE